VASWAYLFDRDGEMLDEFGGIFKRSSGVNSIGELRFTLAVNDEKNIESNLRFKNWIVILNDDGREFWAGRLDKDRGWGNGTSKHFAYSAEDMFNDRIGPYSLPYALLNTAGVIAKNVLAIANEKEDTLIRPGDIYTGGKRCGTFISPATYLSENLAQVVKQSGHEWEVVPQIVNNHLTLYLNWYERIGTEVDGGLNDRNCKVDEDSLTEITRPLKNRMLGVGSDKEVKTNYLASNRASIDKFGLQEGRIDVNAGTKEGVEYLTRQELAWRAFPADMFKATATNIDGTYTLLRKGNVLSFENAKAGYGPKGTIGTQSAVRIMGMADGDDVEGIALSIQKEN